MLRHGIPTNDPHKLTKDFGGKFSVGPGDVHFTPEGSREIATQVALEIGKELPKKK
jgi:hypothetical protein